MVAQRLAMALATTHHRIQVLIPEEGELAESVQAALDQATDEMKSASRVGAPDLAVFVQVEDADVGEFLAIYQLVQVAGEPFQVGPPLPKSVDPGLNK